MTPSSVASRPSAPSRSPPASPASRSCTPTASGPATSVAGILSLTNKGDKPGVLALGVTGRRDRPGAYGGRLGNVLRLKVEDMSGRTPARESVVNQASTFALGTMVGRETRNYRVTATFPDGGIPPTPFTGDNALQGSSVEARAAVEPDRGRPGADQAPGRSAGDARAARRADAAARRRQAPAAADPARAEAARAQAARPQGVRQVPDQVQGALHRAHRQRAGQEEGQEEGCKKRKTLQKKKLLKGERKWRKLRAGQRAADLPQDAAEGAPEAQAPPAHATAASASRSSRTCARPPARAPPSGAS